VHDTFLNGDAPPSGTDNEAIVDLFRKKKYFYKERDIASSPRSTTSRESEFNSMRSLRKLFLAQKLFLSLAACLPIVTTLLHDATTVRARSQRAYASAVLKNLSAFFASSI